MTQSQVLDVRPSAIQRKDYGLAAGKGKEWGGLATVPFFGIGEQIVENMQFESGFYRKMFGNSLFKSLSGESSVIQDILLLEEFEKGDGTFQRIVAFRSSESPDRFKVRAIDDDGTIITPTGGAGDIEFTSSVFGWVQIGLNGYISNKDTTASLKNLFSWDGTKLTAVTSAPDNPDFISRDGQRIALGAEGIMSFSQRSTAVISSFTGGSGIDVDGNYNVSNPGLQKGAVSAAGALIIFFERGAELHKVTVNSDGTGLLGETRISAAAGGGGWNYNGNGISNNFQVTSNDNFTYFANTDGLMQMNPLTGETQNLVEGNGAIQKIWEGLDLSDSVVRYSPKDLLVCVPAKNDGEAVNDFMICWSTQEERFYIKTRPGVIKLGVIDNQLFGAEQSGTNIYKIFDKDSFEDGDGGTPTSKIIREWDSLGGATNEKRLQRVITFMSINPDSTANVNVYLDGFTNLANSYNVTEEDIDDISQIFGSYGDYVGASGTPDTTTNTDVVKSEYFTQRFGTITTEITEESQLDFRVYGYNLLYTITPTSEGAKQFVSRSYATSTF